MPLTTSSTPLEEACIKEVEVSLVPISDTGLINVDHFLFQANYPAKYRRRIYWLFKLSNDPSIKEPAALRMIGYIERATYCEKIILKRLEKEHTDKQNTCNTLLDYVIECEQNGERIRIEVGNCFYQAARLGQEKKEDMSEARKEMEELLDNIGRFLY